MYVLIYTERMALRFDSLEQLLAASRAELGRTDWVTVSQDDVASFADATRAHEWIHTDPERAAREGPFGTAVAHGYLTLALATHFQTQLLQSPPGFVGINYGLERVRFPAPVPVGSRVRALGELVGATPFAAGARTLVRLTYECDATEKSPCVADVVSLVVPT